MNWFTLITEILTAVLNILHQNHVLATQRMHRHEVVFGARQAPPRGPIRRAIYNHRHHAATMLAAESMPAPATGVSATVGYTVQSVCQSGVNGCPCVNCPGASCTCPASPNRSVVTGYSWCPQAQCALGAGCICPNGQCPNGMCLCPPGSCPGCAITSRADGTATMTTYRAVRVCNGGQCHIEYVPETTTYQRMPVAPVR